MRGLMQFPKGPVNRKFDSLGKVFRENFPYECFCDFFQQGSLILGLG